MKTTRLLIVLGIMLSALVVPLTVQATSQGAAAERCGYFVTKYRIIRRDKKNLSAVHSKRNSNRKESANLTIQIERDSSDTSEITAGVKMKVGGPIAEIESEYGVSIARTTGKRLALRNEMSVMPLHYGRVRWQSIRTHYEKYRYYLSPRTCKRGPNQMIWQARMITSKVHFAECQDKRNLCAPY